MNESNTPHGLNVAPREYRISFATADGTLTRFTMDGYSIEDALRRARRAGWTIPASSVHQVKCVGQRQQSAPEAPLTPTGERELARQRIYDFMRNVDPESAEALEQAEKDIAAFLARHGIKLA